MMSSSSEATHLPALPKSVLDTFGAQIQQAISGDMLAMQEETIAGDEKRDLVFKHLRAVFKNTPKIQFAVRTGDAGSIQPIIEESKAVIDTILEAICGDTSQREGRLSGAIEKFTEIRMMQHFFATGKLASFSVLQPCNDDEYIGAALGFAQELARYVVGRASEGDERSIGLCQALIVQINAKMLEFDFRNGPLRRKYDGLKYALKNVEDVLYELSLLHSEEEVAEGNAAKRARIEGTEGSNGGNGGVSSEQQQSSAPAFTLLDAPELDDIRARMDAYDKLREEVIKQSRDIQKLSKQAIFSVHRGALGESKQKLDQASKLAASILAMIAPHPGLRAGAFSNSLEEWAEGALTLEWVQGKRIMRRADMPFVSTSEYVGALSDFTGEIGRLAVAAASKRDIEAVRGVLQADVAIFSGLMQVNVSGKYGKKVDAVAQNLRKVEDVVYELSMLKRGARGVGAREQAPVGGGGVEGDEV